MSVQIRPFTRVFLLAFGLLILVTAVAVFLSDDADAGTNTLIVNSTADPGNGVCDAINCTLREAITGANSLAPANIGFNIPACPPACTIVPASPLPAINGGAITIDGTTEPDYNGTPIVIVDGSVGFFGSGLTLADNDIIVRGLVVQNFAFDGISLASGFSNRQIEENIIRDNGISGVSVAGFDTSITSNEISGNSSDGINAAVGGDHDGLIAHDNHIFDNDRSGIAYSLDNATITDNVVTGNGSNGVIAAGSPGGQTTFTGNTASGNNGAGLFAVGDTLLVADNVVTGNSATGIFVSRGVGEIKGNLMSDNGTLGLGTPGLVVTGVGAKVVTDNTVDGNNDGGVIVLGSGNVIGGTEPEDANTITNNVGIGVSIGFGPLPDATSNTILGNSIHGNSDLGIDLGQDGLSQNDDEDLDEGDNRGQNFPELTSAVAGSLTVEGSLNSRNNRDYRIEFFASSECDPSTFGEGETFLGFLNVKTGDNDSVEFTFNTSATVPVGQFITATATDLDTDNTSEFSHCVEVTGASTTTPTPSTAATPILTPTPTPAASETPTQAATPTPTPTGGPSPTLVQGDVDCGGAVNPIDSLKVLRFDAGLSVDREPGCPEMGIAVPAGGAPPVWGDVDCSGGVDPIDSLKILRFDAGLGVAQEPDCPDLNEPFG